jgi:tetratricopeptide (TPR) repeat protein
MKDLSATLDDRYRERLQRALQELDEQAFGVIAEDVIESIGVHVSSIHHEGRTVVMEGTGKETKYLIFAGRDRSLATLERVAELAARAAGSGRQAVLMTTAAVPKAVEEAADREGISLADQERTMLLMRKYGQADRLLADVDRRLLEADGPRALPSMGRLDDILQEAARAYSVRDYEATLSLAAQALEMKGSSDRAWELRANAMYQLKRYEEASYACRRAMEARPSDGGLHFLLALILEDDGRLEDALAEYDLALKSATGMAGAILNKGALLYRQGRYEWASKVFEQMIRYHPQDPRGHNNLGMCLQAMGKTREARQAFARASALDPGYVDPLVNMAALEPDPGKQADAWKKVVALAPGMQRAWSMIGIFASVAGREEEAVRALRRALELDPTDGEAKATLARLQGETAVAKSEERLPAPAADRQMPAEVEQAPMPATAERPQPPAVAARASPPAMPVGPTLPAEMEEPKAPAVMTAAPKPVEVKEVAHPMKAGVATPPTEAVEAQLAHGFTGPLPAENAAAARPTGPPQEAALPDAEEYPDEPIDGARVLLAVGRYQQALDRLLGVEGRQADRLRADILFHMGRLAEARDELVRSMAGGRSEADMLDAEALSYSFGNGDACLELLSALEPSKEGKARQAAVLLELNRLGEIIARAPNFGEEASHASRMALASALMLRTRYRDAHKVLRALLDERPTDPEALNSLGICMRHMGEYGYDEPAKLFRAAIAIDQSYADAWNNLGCVYFITTKYAEAQKAIAQAVKLQRRPEFLANLATCHLMLGDIEAAKAALTSAMKLDETPDVLFALALIAEKEEDLRWAVRLYEDALAKAPGYRQAQVNRDRALVKMRNQKK